MNGAIHRSILVPLGLVLALALAAPAARAQEKAAEGPDVVHVFNRERTAAVARKGEVIEETPNVVKVRTADGDKTIRREDVKEVAYGGLPPGLGQAELLIAKSDFEGAARAFEQVALACDEGKARAIFKPRALVGKGRALVNAGRFDEAGEAFQDAIKASDKYKMLVRDAVREGVRAWIRGKDAKKALEAANGAKAAFKAAELPDDTQDEAQLLIAEAREAGGDIAEARRLYNLLVNSRDGRVRGRALLGAARAALLNKEIERAAGQYRQILAEKDVERSVRCGAARGLGDASLARPGAWKDVGRLRAAATAYAQALAVHFPARGEPTEDREAALHECAKVYDALAELSPGERDAKARELYGAMARQLREELVRLYKTSQYRPENEQKLAKAAHPDADGPK